MTLFFAIFGIKSEMMIKELLMSEHSKKVTDRIVNDILEENTNLDELMSCFFSSDHRICQRSAWAVGIIGEKHGELLNKYISKMIKAASQPVHNAIKRNVVRAFQYMDLPNKYIGQVYEFCYTLASEPTEAIAVKAFAMRTCLKIAKKHPELKNELRELIELYELDESPGIQSVIRSVKKELN